MKISKNIIDKKTVKKITKDWVIPLAIGLVLATSVRTYALTRVDVNGISMATTLENKDIMFEEKISLYTDNIKHGDIITFDSHDKEMPSYIKRVIGLAGDQIEIINGKVYLNGSKLEENYLAAKTLTFGDDFLQNNTKYTVPAGQVFVMGDNRRDSSDSRYFGPVKIKDIQGKVFVRVFPFHSFKLF
jgi:signal peptidase I